jgi:ribokinase
MGRPRPRICVVGSSNLDLTVRTPRLPAVGETLTAHDFQVGCGGKGGNQAVMAARLGAEVSLVSCVGADSFGEQILQSYQRHGIDVRHLHRDPDRPTGVATILVDDQARNCILVVAGANATLSAERVRAAGEALAAADVVLGQLEVPVPAVIEAFRLARAAGARTLLNPAPAQPLPAELLQTTDICIPNETEIQTLTGLSVDSLPQAETAARRLLEQGPGVVVVTLGTRGALLVTRDSVQHIPAQAVQAVDPTGAGDAFIGSLAVFLAEGARLEEAARRASVAAALTVTRPGTHGAFPSREEIATRLAD